MSFLTPDELDGADAGRDAAAHHADPDADRLQRRIHSGTRRARSSSEVEARLLDMSDELGKKQGLSRRALLSDAPPAWRPPSSP